jgi:hypothetical protein
MIIFQYIRTLEEKYQEVEELNKQYEMERLKHQYSLNSTSKLNRDLCIDPCYS